MKSKISALFIFFVLYSQLTAQGIFRVSPKGFNKSGAYEFNPKYFTRMGNKLYFFATDVEDGLPANKLWVTDGTWQNTKIVKQINNYIYTTLHDMGSVSDAVLFFDDKDSFLWRSDGTEAGTIKIKKIKGKGFFYFNNKLFFEGIDKVTGYKQIWITDGTTNGTIMLKDLGTSDNYAGFNGPKVVYKNKLIAAVSPSFYEFQLWESDGTAAGTKLIKDCNPLGRDDISEIIIVNDTLYFRATHTGSGGASPYLYALWKSDGTATGTKIVYKLDYPNSFYANNLTALNNKLYFLYNSDFWTSDGSTLGTKKINLDTSNGGSLLFYPDNLLVVNNKLIFRINHKKLGYQIATLNPAENKINLFNLNIKDFNPTNLKSFGNGVIFLAKCNPLFNTTTYNQLYYTNGTDTGTKMAIPPSFSTNKGISMLNFSNGDYNYYNNNMYFTANYDHILGFQLFRFTLDSTSKPEENAGTAIKNTNEIVVFPNPSKGNFTIKSDAILKYISIYNCQGKLIFQTSYRGKEYKCNLTSSGLYYIEVKNLKNKYIQKILIE